TFFQHYTSSDLISSGMSEEELITIRDPSIPLEERWRVFTPYWERTRNTGYARAISIAARDLYGVEGISEDTYLELSRRMKTANKEGLYRWVLKERAGVEVSILDSLEGRVDVDREFFAPVRRFDDYLLVKERSELDALARRCGMPIHSLSDLVKAMEMEFKGLSKVLVGIKIALAYRRDLHFEKATYDEAERVFNRVCSQRFFKRYGTDRLRVTLPEALSFEEAKPLQDFMVHKAIRLATEHGLPVQIHTGLQEGNLNILTNSDPTQLTNLFMEYKDAKFDIFHGSYPYTGELSALAKNFPNVYIDMCWLHIISPYVARKALSEWLDTVPGNKILGFGGDYKFVEGVYGHAILARENVARVLAEKVEDDGYTEEEAVHLARRILHDNAYELYFSRRP
ncbi:MAG: amidohydrolase family protein, partial [Candidatus Bathyarchaeia archaeon]